MRNKFIALLTILCLIVTAAYANTTHYSYNTPTVGGSQNTWGTSLNTIFNSIDTNVWQASEGTTIALGVTSTGVNFALANPINRINDIAMTTTGKVVSLSPMNATASPVAGGIFAINNTGSNAFAIDANDGSTSVVSSLGAGQSVLLEALTNSTTNGTFIAFGPYLSSIGNIVIGTSLSGANPALSGDLTTGLYSPGAAQIGFTVSGTQRALWNTSGQTVTGTLSVSSALLFTGTGAAATGQTGVHSTTANALSFMTTGTDRMVVANDGGVTIGAATGGSKGAGTLNLSGAGIYVNGTLFSGGIGNVTGQTFCASGCTHTAGTYTPTAGTKFIIVELNGGGGGGGGTAGASCSVSSSGGAGGYVKAILTAAQAGTPTITLGAAGTAGSAGTNAGGAGGTTSMGSLLSATGGGAGSANTGCTSTGGGAGGTGTVTTGIMLEIATGQAGGAGVNSTLGVTEAGGNNLLGVGGAATLSGGGTVAGVSATGFGAGGSGAVSGGGNSGITQTGGTGGVGFVSITEFQ